MKSRLSTQVRSQCATYAGTVRNGKLVGERCGLCPIYGACREWGGMPVRVDADLEANAKWFNARAAQVLGGVA